MNNRRFPQHVAFLCRCSYILFLCFFPGWDRLQAQSTGSASAMLAEKYIGSHDGNFNSVFFYTNPKYSIYREQDSLNVAVDSAADLRDLIAHQLEGKVHAVLFRGSDSLDLDECFRLLQLFPRVVFLKFSDFSLFGKRRTKAYELPQRIALLKHLRGVAFEAPATLNLRSAVAVLSTLPHLSVFSISGYDLPLPDNIDLLRRLQVIRLTTDNLKGVTLPVGLRWQEVQLVKRKENGLHAIREMRRLPFLRVLKTEYFEAQSVGEIAGLPRLDVLQLRSVQKGAGTVIGDLLPHLAHLKVLYIHFMADSTETLDGLDKLSKLEVLSLRGNHFLKADPARLQPVARLSHLRQLDISDVAALPFTFAGLLHLQELRLEGYLGDSLPASVFQLPELTSLAVPSSRLTSLPDTRWQLPKLRSLYVKFGRLRSLPEAITTLNNLEQLDASYNAIEQIPLQGWEQLKKLRTIDLSVNNLRYFPGGLERISGLRTVALASNSIEELPAFTAPFYHLKKLDLSANELKTLPESTGRLDSLEVLLVTGNRLVSLPGSLGNLLQLQELSAGSRYVRTVYDRNKQLAAAFSVVRDTTHRNRIASLPAGLKNAAGLKLLDLSGNAGIDARSVFEVVLARPRNRFTVDLSGCAISLLPESDHWRYMTFEKLDLSNNRLLALPMGLGDIKGFREVLLRNNPLGIDAATTNRPVHTQADLQLLYDELAGGTSSEHDTSSAYVTALTSSITGLYDNKSWHKAVNYATRALATYPDIYSKTVKWDEIGIARYQLNDYEGAIADFEAFIKKEATIHIHWQASLDAVALYKSKAHLALGQQREAAESYLYFARQHAIISGYPQAALLYGKMGDSLRSRQLIDSAVGIYKTNYSRRNGFGETGDMLDYAEVLLMAGDYTSVTQMLAKRSDSSFTTGLLPVKRYLLALAAYLHEPDSFVNVKESLINAVALSGKAGKNWNFDLFHDWMMLPGYSDRQRQQFLELERLVR